MNYIIIQMIIFIYLFYINIILLNIQNKQKEYNLEINKITNILFNIHKKNVELTDIKLEELEENILTKLKS